MNKHYSNLRSFASYLVENHLNEMAREVVENAVNLQLPVLKLVHGINPDKLVDIARKILTDDILLPLTSEDPFSSFKRKIDLWKNDSIDLPQNQLKLEDITLINLIIQKSLTKRLVKFQCSREEFASMIEELEGFFQTCMQMSVKVFEEIQRKESSNKDEILSGILTNMPVVVTRIDKQGIITFSSGSGLKTLGLKEQELRGKNLREQYPYAENGQKALEGVATSFVGSAKSAEGEIRQFQTYYVPEKTGALAFSIDITKEREAEELLVNFVQGVKDYAIFLLQPNGNIATWNEGAEKLKGYTKEEIIGKHFSIFYPQEKKESKFPEYELQQTALLGKFEDEGYRIKKDGTTFWANVLITAIYNGEKKLIGYTKITRDLTERKLAEEKLRQSEERFRRLVDGVRDYAIFMLNLDGTVASWNQGARNLKGYTQDEILGKHFSIFYSQKKRDEHYPDYELQQAVLQGRFEDEGLRIRKDGTSFWANVVISPIYNSLNQLVGFTKITRDLSERRQAEENLRRSEERSRLLIEAVKDYAIFMLDTDGRITSWNLGAKRLTGYSEAEILGKNMSIFYTEEKKAEKYPEYELEQSIIHGRFEDEGLRIRKDGTSFFANVIITALFNKNNKHIGFSKITQDLTHRKLLERNLQDMNTQLEQKVKERTEELTRTVHELKKINNDLDNFIYTASHDLKAPVSNIEGLIQGLFEELGEDSGLKENIKMFRELIHSSIRRFQKTLLELTEIAKIQKESPEETELITLKEVIEDVTSGIQTLIAKNGAEITFDFGETDHIRFVRKNLKSIFYNIISNAIKYRSPERTPMINIQSYTDGDYQVIHFTDNGLGIKPENTEKIFSMFKRFHDHVEGSGVGLYIVKRIIDNAGGKIEVESTEGKGTTFKIFIPQPEITNTAPLQHAG